MCNILQNYILPKKNIWQGRSTHEKDAQYWYQAVECQSLLDFSTINKKKAIALLSYSCDEGVRLNLGRQGAAEAPQIIKGRLARLPFHFGKNLAVYDFGEIKFKKGNSLPEFQKSFALAIEKLLDFGVFPIPLGGGHDIAYAHFSGIQSFRNKTHPKNEKKPAIGIINLDAHFDLRPIINHESNSGTPFYQIIEEFGGQVKYFPIGIQSYGNTPSLYKYAEKKNIKYIPIEDCTINNFEKINILVNQFVQEVDEIYLTVDMDGVASSFAPGVSAPSVLGFSPKFLFSLVHIIFKSKKVISCDIAETNPNFDTDNRTVDLVARLVSYITRLNIINNCG